MEPPYRQKQAETQPCEAELCLRHSADFTDSAEGPFFAQSISRRHGS
jgi:hypothetical protein